MVYSPLTGSLKTVPLNPVVSSFTCATTSKLEFVAGFVIIPSYGKCLLGL